MGADQQWMQGRKKGKTVEQVKKHFEGEAKEYDEIILRLIPYYPEMLDGLVTAIPHDRSKSINVIDLGCGTGTVTKKIKDMWPASQITCLDLAENMIERARIKLSEYSDIRFQTGDVRNYEFGDSYDVVASSLALHHLVTDKEKRTLYERIYDSLHPDGVFLNADVILGANQHIQRMYMEKWTSFMRQHVSDDEIENKWLPKYREEDHPAKLMDHLAWLTEAGFRQVDVVWKYYNFAVYCGYRPTA